MEILLLTQPHLYKEKMTKRERAVLWFGREFCNEKTNLFQYRFPSAKSMGEAMDAFNNVTREIALSGGLKLVELDKLISKDLLNFIDDVHFTEKGAKQVAMNVSNMIINQRIIEKAEND